MYGAILCPGCRKPRVTNLSVKHSSCPRCGREAELRKARILFQSDDLREVRSFINSLSTGEEYAPLQDPMSLLRREVEREKDPEEKLRLLADGLTRILGDFDQDDIEAILPNKGERFLKQMIAYALVIERPPGRYQVI